MTDLVFAEKDPETLTRGVWKVLIVDDDPGIHSITRTVLRDLNYDSRTLEFLSASSRRSAMDLLRQETDIALILLDVVMEEEDSGLQLVRFIREELDDSLVRIVLRTGQPGRAPSQKVIIEYDINDYEEKTDLTAQKLYTTVIASLRNYRDLKALDKSLRTLDRNREGLSCILDAASVFFGSRNFDSFARQAFQSLKTLVRTTAGEESSAFMALQDGDDYEIVEATGRFATSVGREPNELLGKDVLDFLRGIKKEERNLLVLENGIFLYEDVRKTRLLFHISGIGRMDLLDRQLLEIFASNVSIAFENLRLNRNIVDTQTEIVTRLAEVVETRSHDTAQHVKRVSEFVALLGAKIGLQEEELRDLKMAACLHDIGKIGVSDKILLKPESLTSQEFEVMKTHTTLGYHILENSDRPILKNAAMICRDHHEKFDGSGYPQGRAGGDIHIYGRIVAICDVFDTLTHGQMYKDAWTVELALENLEKEKGKAFDPNLVEAFLSDRHALDEILRNHPD